MVLIVNPPTLRGVPLGGRPLDGRLLRRPRLENAAAPSGSGAGFRVVVPKCGAIGEGRSSAPVDTLKLIRPPPMAPPSEPPPVGPWEPASAAEAAPLPLALPPAPRLEPALGLVLGQGLARPAGAKKHVLLHCVTAGFAVGEAHGTSVPPPPRAPNCRKRCGLGRTSLA